MSLNKIKKAVCTTLVVALVVLNFPIPAEANEWVQVDDNTSVSNTTNTTDYYHLGLGWHATWQRTNGAWTDGTPGTNQSQTLTVDTSVLASHLGIANKNILNVTVVPYTENLDFVKDWSSPRFAFYQTEQNEGNHYSFIQNYKKFFSTSYSVSNVNYNKTTKKLTYTKNYSLKTTQNGDHGLLIHTEFRKQIAKGKSYNEAVAATEKYIQGYTGTATPPAVDYSVLYNNPATAATLYFQPMVYIFTVENTDPVIIWETVDDSEKVICADGKSGGILFTVKNAKKEWLKLDGYIEFTDAIGEIKDWKVTHKVQYNESSLYATRTSCIEYVPRKVKASYTPDPLKPNERYCSEFDRPENDMGVTNIKLENNNKNVSAPVVGKEHTILVYA